MGSIPHTILIKASLVNKPTEPLSLRLLTLIVKSRLNYEILYFCNKDKRDFYYKKYKKQGLLDFADDFVFPDVEKVDGLFLDKEPVYAPTIVIKGVHCQNFNTVLGQIYSFFKL